ncbi:MAG: hypothetical protein WC763_07210 [Candidatus Paceibacterota bacterium]|jgi:hypothetical protein
MAASKSLQLSKSDVHALVKKAETLQNRIAKVKDKADNMVEQGVRTAITTGTAFGFGVLQTRVGGVELFGVPAELLAGFGAHAAAFLGIGGKATSMLHDVGNGALAAWAVTMGRGVGSSMGSPKSAVKGEAMTDDEMERLSKQQG